MSLQSKQSNRGAVIGACIAVLSAIPVAAYLGVFFGDTYNSRAYAYILILAWTIIGSYLLLAVVSKKTSNFSISLVLLWIASVWLWPILLLVYKTKK